MNDLTIKFNNRDQLEHFSIWLCEQGEQDYWTWMEAREYAITGDITVIKFTYNHPEDEKFASNDSRRYKNSKFLGIDYSNPTILTKGGRLDRY